MRLNNQGKRVISYRRGGKINGGEKNTQQENR